MIKKFGKRTKGSGSKLFEQIQKKQEDGDFLAYHNQHVKRPFWVCYYKSLIDTKKLHQDVLSNLKAEFEKVEEVISLVPIENITVQSDLDILEEKLLQGEAILFLDENSHEFASIPIQQGQSRQVGPPEIEFSVEGPKEAFVESLDTNLNLIRRRLPVPDLRVEELQAGKLSKTKIAIVYIQDKAAETEVNKVIEHIRNLKFEQVLDSSFIMQMLEDNKLSPFPQFVNTERPDRACGYLGEGKLLIFVDGSPYAVSGPTTLIEFFSSIEDYYLSWQIGTVLRLIRYVAVSFSIISTPVYVAVLTYHYELIPKDMLGTLIGSRSNVPFPPILEALFLEVTIELLREAGARLPTKIGQTIGIVGGIVIGQASVEAGLTSNILLIIVALAALASFTTPVYRMGNTVRLLRFPFLFMAGIWGLLGLVITFLFVLVHLLRLESLGRPYLEPIFPPQFKYWKDSFVRFPFFLMHKATNRHQAKDPAAQTRHQKKINEFNE